MTPNPTRTTLLEEDILLDFQEACRYLKYSESAMYTAISRREIPHYKIRGRLRFSKAALDAWIASCEVPITSVRRKDSAPRVDIPYDGRDGVVR